MLNPSAGPTPEPPRVYRRLHSLRGWGHGETEPVFSGGAGASGAMVFEHTKQTAQGLSWSARAASSGVE